MSKIVVKKIAYIKYFIISSIFLILGIFFLYLSLDTNERVVINYQSNKNIDYQVFLKNNNFFEQPFLSKGTTYISSLINYINIDYKYNFEYDKAMDSEYTFYIKGTILADKSSNEEGNYWKKEYILQEKQTNKLENSNIINISSNLKIDYQKYNELLTSFKQEYGLTIDGKLKVELIVDIESINDEIKKPIKTNDSLELVIPLTEKTVDIRINTNEEKNKIVNNYIETTKKEGNNQKIYRIIAILLLLIMFLSLIRIIHLKTKSIRSESEYSKTLKKILTTYDAIIVNTANEIELENYNIVEVNNFNELLDAHSEIRMPINYIRKNDYSKFILINDKTAWIYTLKK